MSNQHKSLLRAECAIEKAERELREKMKAAYPAGTRVVVEASGSKIVVEITKHSHRLRELVGFNVKTGNMRNFSYLHIVEVVKA